jgi:hypothetical protein
VRVSRCLTQHLEADLRDRPSPRVPRGDEPICSGRCRPRRVAVERWCKASLIELRRPAFPYRFSDAAFGANTGNSLARKRPIWRAFVDGSDGTRTRDLRRDRCAQSVSTVAPSRRIGQITRVSAGSADPRFSPGCTRSFPSRFHAHPAKPSILPAVTTELSRVLARKRHLRPAHRRSVGGVIDLVFTLRQSSAAAFVSAARSAVVAGGSGGSP